MIDLDRIAQAPMVSEPFQFFKAEGVLSPEALSTISKDFPDITQPGVFPLPELKYGPAFEQLIGDTSVDETSQVIV